MKNKVKVLIKGPVLTTSGYGEHARLVVDSLLENEELDVYVAPISWGQTSWLYEGHPLQEKYIQLLRKTSEHISKQGTFDVSVQVTIPTEFERIAPINIGVTAGIETNHVSPQWLEKSNMMDKLVVVSEFSKQGFTGTFYEGKLENGASFKLTLNRPIEVIGYPVKDVVPSEKTKNLQFDTKFNFFTVSQWGPRKNLVNLVSWFVEEFFDQEVGLVIKTSVKNNSTMDQFECEKGLKQLLSKYEGRKCKVYLLHGDMLDEEIRGLFLNPSLKCYLSLSHGEGYGLGMFEAAYCGMPVVAPEWSGYLDFMYLDDGKKKKAAFAKVDYKIDNIQPEAIWPGVLEQGTMWAFPQQGSFKMKIREVSKDYDRFKSQAKKLQQQICQNFTKEKIYKQYQSLVLKGGEDDQTVTL